MFGTQVAARHLEKARHQVGAIMEAEARGRQVLEMELAVLLEGGL